MKKLIVANWKANPETTEKAKALARATERALSSAYRNIEIVVAPPFPFLERVRPILSRARLGAQDMFWTGGAYTGAVSPGQLVALGVSSVIIGHSERRMYMGETDATVRKKLHAALARGFCAVLCVGERERHGGVATAVVGDQLASALTGLKKGQLTRLAIAYEPVWAISTTPGGAGADTPDSAFRVRLYIEKVLASLFGARSAKPARVIYGGSVAPDNTAAYMREGKMDGVLVGGASLDAKAFSRIVAEVARSATEIA